MAPFLLDPAFVFGYDVVFKFIFVIITAAVSYYSFKFSKFSGSRKSFLFAVSFSLLSASYLVQGIFGIGKFSQGLGFLVAYTIGIYLHLLLFAAATGLLSYINIGTKNKKTLALILLLSIIPIVLSPNSIYIGFVIVSLLLFFISVDYLTDYARGKKSKSLIISIAFFLLFASHIHFILAVNHILFYAVGNFLELIAYLMILINLIIAITK